MGRWWARGLLTLYLAAGAFLTLRPSPQGRLLSAAIRAVHGHTGLSWQASGWLTERSANVVLFVPAGLLLCWALPRARRWAVWWICVASSGAVELVQDLFLPDRHPSAVDVATNSAGAAIGVLVHWVLTRRADR